jgi:hypothetical protein
MTVRQMLAIDPRRSQRRSAWCRAATRGVGVRQDAELKFLASVYGTYAAHPAWRAGRIVDYAIRGGDLSVETPTASQPVALLKGKFEPSPASQRLTRASSPKYRPVPVMTSPSLARGRRSFASHSCLDRVR